MLIPDASAALPTKIGIYEIYIESEAACGENYCLPYGDISLKNGIVQGSTVNFRSQWGDDEPIIVRPDPPDPDNPINGQVYPGYLPVVFDKVGTFYWTVEGHPEVSSFVKVIEAPPPPPPSTYAEDIPADKRLKIQSGEWVVSIMGTGKTWYDDSSVTYDVSGEFAFTINQDGFFTVLGVGVGVGVGVGSTSIDFGIFPSRVI